MQSSQADQRKQSYNKSYLQNKTQETIKTYINPWKPTAKASLSWLWTTQSKIPKKMWTSKNQKENKKAFIAWVCKIEDLMTYLST